MSGVGVRHKRPFLKISVSELQARAFTCTVFIRIGSTSTYACTCCHVSKSGKIDLRKEKHTNTDTHARTYAHTERERKKRKTKFLKMSAARKQIRMTLSPGTCISLRLFATFKHVITYSFSRIFIFLFRVITCLFCVLTSPEQAISCFLRIIMCIGFA